MVERSWAITPLALAHILSRRPNRLRELPLRPAIDAFPNICVNTKIPYPSGSARTCLPRLEHDDIQVGILLLEAVGCEGASNAAPNDNDISNMRQVVRRTVAKEYLGRLCEPVRLAWVVDWKPSGGVR